MPIFTLECPDCGHVFRGTVLAGTKPPEIWVCSRCRGEAAAERPGASRETHPWENPDHAGCTCCG
jgi:hypothetical protein